MDWRGTEDGPGDGLGIGPEMDRGWTGGSSGDGTGMVQGKTKGCGPGMDQPFCPSLELQGVVVTQGQDLALGLVELGLSPWVQPGRIPLQIPPVVQRINTLPSLVSSVS
ncbi:hypothetical protein WISP_62477 [Willisornis vidua]|uniref:Uncharacterized protein n=1 Tax=Willisornis vidua TaxID=1566151 RepID=A0ABQ9DAT2_9PASS|nr:hypothetical protein WISP_62477 [Willisornis vidua]